MTKSVFILAVVGLFFAIAGVAYRTATASRQVFATPANLQVKEIVEEGEVFEFATTVVNDGSQRINITQFNAECGCTSLGSDTILPAALDAGESLSIPISIDTLGIRGERQFRGQFRYATDNGQVGEIEVSCGLKVLVGLHALPSIVHMGEVAPGETFTQSVDLCDSLPDGHATLVSVRSSSPSILSVKKEDSAGTRRSAGKVTTKRHKLTLRYEPNSVPLSREPIREFIELAIESKSRTTNRLIPVIGTLSPEFRFSPNQVVLTPKDRSKRVYVALDGKNAGNASFAVSNAEEPLKTSLERINDNEWELVLEVRGNDESTWQSAQPSLKLLVNGETVDFPVHIAP
ncbi:MAG: hypothetical protein AB8B50_04055 [Pirellulaceae bacterium]